MAEKSSHWLHVGHRITFWFLTWLGVVLVDPLGSYSFVAAKAAKVYALGRAPFYGQDTPGGLARDRIAVVVLTPEERREYPSFPLTAAEYGDILAGIMEHGPRAVFVDIGFGLLHQDKPAFMDDIVTAAKAALREPPAKPVPLWFGIAKPTDQTMRVGKDTAAAVSDVFDIGYASTWHDGDADVYQLRQAADDPRAPLEDASAALALYRLVCTGETCPSKRPDGYNKDLALQWGVQPPRSSDGERGCLRAARGWFGRVLAGNDRAERLVFAAQLAGRGLLPGLPSLAGFGEPTQPCRYHEDLGVSDLDLHPDAADRVLRNRVVFLGQVSDDDKVDTPFGPVTGVYVHAMALDNLLTYGADYFYDPGKLPGGIPFSRLMTGALWLVLSLALAAIVEWTNWFDRFPSKPEHPVIGWLIDVLIAAVVTAVLVVIDFRVRWRFSGLLVFSAMVPILFEAAKRHSKKRKSDRATS